MSTTCTHGVLVINTFRQMDARRTAPSSIGAQNRYPKNTLRQLRVCLQTSYRSQISEAARHTKAAKTSASLS